MKYKIEEIKNQKVWNDFVEKQDFVNILSSWEWIEFERELGFETKAFRIENKGVFAFRIVNSKKGKFLLLKQNTFVDWNDEDVVSLLISFLKLKCKEQGCKFFRISPTLLHSLENEKLFLKYGFKKSVLPPADGQLTTVLNLQKSLDDMQKDMRKNTRYLVRKAEKLHVEVLHTDGDEYLDDFARIYDETVKRHGWDASEFDYIEKQYNLFSSEGLSKMFVAKHEGKVLAVAVFTKFQNQVIYHHSGSILTEVPVMYALIWGAIKYYKELGLKGFNFFGVSEKNDIKHSWHGLSLFKRGFGGEERKLLNTYDYSVSPNYYLIRAVEALQRFKR